MPSPHSERRRPAPRSRFPPTQLRATRCDKSRRTSSKVLLLVAPRRVGPAQAIGYPTRVHCTGSADREAMGKDDRYQRICTRLIVGAIVVHACAAGAQAPERLDPLVVTA